MLNRKLAPAFRPIKSLQVLEPEHIQYPNALTGFVFQDPQLELIRFEFVFKNVFGNPEKPILNTVLAAMLREGTASMSSEEIADQIDFYGAYLIPEYSLDHTSLTLYTMHKYVDKVLPIVHDILTNSIFPAKELDTYIRNNKQSLQISLKKNDVVARRLFFSQIFGENRYGVVPTAEFYDSITQQDVLTLYEQQIQPHNCTLFISGRVDAEVLQYVREAFGENWHNRQENRLEYTVPMLQEQSGELLVEEREGALQSALRLGKRTINRTHPDFPAVQFVNTLLGGFFGSRLMRNIREEKGYTYGIGSSVSSLQHTGLFTLSSEVGVEVTQATLLEIEKEFDLLRQSPPEQAEVDLVRNYLQGVMLGSLENVFSHADKFKATYFSDMDLNYYSYYAEIIDGMTTQKVQDIAQEYFDYNDLLKVVVGKIK